MITFKQYMQTRQLLEFDVSTNFMDDAKAKIPSSDVGKWNFATGGGSGSERTQKALAQLFGLLKIATETSPPTVLQFLTRIQDRMGEGFQEILRDMQNSGAWTQLQGIRKSPSKIMPSDDGLEDIAPNIPDAGGASSEEAGNEEDNGGEY